MVGDEIRQKVGDFLKAPQKEASPIRDDLVAMYFRTIKELEVCSKSIKNAERFGDPIVAEFFREIEAQDRLRAWRAEEFLRRNLN